MFMLQIVLKYQKRQYYKYDEKVYGEPQSRKKGGNNYMFII